MNPTQFVPFAGACHLINTVIKVNYSLSFFCEFYKLATDLVFRGSSFTNFFIDSKNLRTCGPQCDLKYVFNANRILHDLSPIPSTNGTFKVCFSRKQSLFRFSLKIFSLVCFVLPVFDPDMRGFLF